MGCSSDTPSNFGCHWVIDPRVCTLIFIYIAQSNPSNDISQSGIIYTFVLEEEESLLSNSGPDSDSDPGPEDSVTPRSDSFPHTRSGAVYCTQQKKKDPEPNERTPLILKVRFQQFLQSYFSFRLL
jgi:hypothetical protein